MDFLEPRKAYHRADSDDSTVELSPLRSTSSFHSGFSNTIRDQAPLLDPQSDPISQQGAFGEKKSWLRRVGWSSRLLGWRAGALTAATLAGISLLVNLVMVSWLAGHSEDRSTLVELYNGSCSKVEEIDVWAHFALNVVSTLLLGGSNYCMQCLCAPTRGDIDRAHAKGKYLDIGVPSVRNLRSIPRYKMILWGILGLSSVPLHLMYNSAFYKSLATNDYTLIFVRPEFVDGAAFNASLSDQSRDIQIDIGQSQIDIGQIQSEVGQTPSPYERLDKADCISAYATDFLSKRRNLVLVSNNSTKGQNSSLLATRDFTFDVTSPYGWVCSSDSNMLSKIDMPFTTDHSLPNCDAYLSKVVAVANDWQPYNFDVQYCLSEIVPERCSYSGNIPILAVVVGCNALKIVVMLFVALRLKDNPLITIGDAIESFLNAPDPTTRRLCLLTKRDVVKQIGDRKHWAVEQDREPPAKVASRQSVRWAQSASRLRWFLTIGIIAFALLVVGVLLWFAVRVIELNSLSIQAIGFGKVTPAAIITGWPIGLHGGPSTAVLESILVANLPQTIFSFIYLHLNGVLTSMWLGSEWSDFASERKALRVSKPKGSLQRGTHFLQLPYKVAVPLMAFSGLFHWLISQSIFLAVVAEYSARGHLISPVAIASCGFSPLAMILCIVFGGCIIIALVALGARKYDDSIPLVGSCSAAISAACHQPVWDADAAMKRVQWGVIPESVDEKGVGHCSFSSGEVEPVQVGREYAGNTDG